MNKYLPWVLFLSLAASSAVAQPILDIEFTSNTSIRHLEQVNKGVTLGVSPDGKNCLQVARGVNSLALKPLPLKPLRKYKLTIRAAVDGKDTIENNDRILEFYMKNYGRSFSAYAVTFLDKKGHKTGLKMRGATLVDNSGVIISGKVNDFIHVFYSPRNVDKMRLDLTPRGNNLSIESIKLEIEKDEGTLNINPDFRYGALSPCGWRPDSDGRLYRRPDGKTVLKSGYGASSPIFLVSDHSRYSVYCKGSSYQARPGKATISFYDENGSQKGSIHLFWADDMKDGATKKGVVPPPGTFQARVDVSRALFEELRVTTDN